MKHSHIWRWIAGILAFASLAYLIFRIYDFRKNSVSSFPEEVNFPLLFLVLLLVPLNWGLELLKWRGLHSGFGGEQNQPWLQALLGGIAVSVFTPNRAGEVAGRLLLLPRNARISAGLASILGSWAQFSITMLAGPIAALFLPAFFYASAINYTLLCLLALCCLSVYLFSPELILKLIPKQWTGKIPGFRRMLREANRKLLWKALYWSALRFLVFSLQSWLLIRALGLEIPLIKGLSCIAFGYFLSTLIPKFAFSEISTRGSSVLISFELAGYSSSVVWILLLATSGIWIINVALPAAAGALVLAIKAVKKSD